jgi:hypothetical protein
LIPIAIGLGACLFVWKPDLFLPGSISTSIRYGSDSIIYGKTMSVIFAIVACSGAFITYSRRASSVLVVLGGLVMEVVWMFFSEYHVN